jgi:hypothetical protein
MFLVNLPVVNSVHSTTRKVFAWSILGVTVVDVPNKVDLSKCPQVTSLPSPFIMDRGMDCGSRRTSVYLVGAQNNCACMKIVLDLSL